MTLCECGCGDLAPIAKETGNGYKAGQAKRFITGHNGRIRPKDPTPLWKRILMKCDWVDECLVYRGYKVKGGYGLIHKQGKNFYVHRVVYEFFFGPVPEGYEVDHVYASGCRNAACCRPDHLEAVTASENCLRRERVKPMRVAA